MYLALNNLQRLICYKTKPNHKTIEKAAQVQILDKADCISYTANIFEKGMNSIILPPALGE